METRKCTRAEAARGPARKAGRWLKSLFKKGIMTVEQKDAMLPDERNRLYNEMIQKRKSSSSLTKDILTHHQQGLRRWGARCKVCSKKSSFGLP